MVDSGLIMAESGTYRRARIGFCTNLQIDSEIVKMVNREALVAFRAGDPRA
jgi:hypothetical protein